MTGFVKNVNVVSVVIPVSVSQDSQESVLIAEAAVCVMFVLMYYRTFVSCVFLWSSIMLHVHDFVFNVTREYK